MTAECLLQKAWCSLDYTMSTYTYIIKSSPLINLVLVKVKLLYFIITCSIWVPESKLLSKYPLALTRTRVIRLEVDITISLTFLIATLSGPKNWNPSSSDNFINDASRSEPVMIRHEIIDWKENWTNFPPATAWTLVVVKLELKYNYKIIKTPWFISFFGCYGVLQIINSCCYFNQVSYKFKGSNLLVSLSLLLQGLSNVTLPLIWPLGLDYQGLAKVCTRSSLYRSMVSTAACYWGGPEINY